MKKILAVLVLLVVISAIVSSCSSRKSGCPTTNPKYFVS